MAKIPNMDITKGWQVCGATGTLIPCWWECKMLQPLWKTVCQFLTKLNISCIWQSTHASWYLPKWLENLYLHKNLHMDVYSSCNHNCQSLKAKQMSVSRWMGKQTVVHPYNEILFSNKINKQWSHKKSWMKLKCILLNVEASLKTLRTIWFQLYDIREKTKLKQKVQG